MLFKRIAPHHITAHPAWITLEYLAILLGTGTFMLIPDGYYHRLLFFVPLALYAMLILWHNRHISKPAGISLRNVLKAFPDYLISTFVLGGLILLTLFVLTQVLQVPGVTSYGAYEFAPPPLFPYLFVAAPLLEFVYRTFLTTRLRQHLRPVNAALLAAFAATFTQIQFTSSFLIGAAFLANFFLSWLYAHRPNWLLSMLSHTAIFGLLLLIFRIWVGLE